MMSRFLLLFCFATLHVLGESVPLNESEYTKEPVDSTVQITMITPVNSETVSESTIASESKTKPTTPSTTTTSSTTPTPSTTTNPTTTDPQSTTIAPNTTTPSSPSTTPSTPVVPPATPGKWVVNGTNKVCIVLQMAVTFNISYNVNSNMTHYKLFNMPIDNTTTKANGSCGILEQELTLQWSTKNLTDGAMTLHFVKNESTSHYSLHHLEVILPVTDFPDANATTNGSMVLVHKEPNFVVGLSNSYRCLKQQKLNLKRNDTNEISGYLTVSGLQFQAFKGDNSTVFGLAKDCAFDTPDVVPIAVGCALAGLVIIVFIAYLVGRRRNEAHGYLSM